LIIGIKSWIFDTNIVTKSMIKFSILVKWSGILMWLIQGRNQPGGIVPNGKIRQLENQYTGKAGRRNGPDG
jgi:hypothetical protein